MKQVIVPVNPCKNKSCCPQGTIDFGKKTITLFDEDVSDDKVVITFDRFQEIYEMFIEFKNKFDELEKEYPGTMIDTTNKTDDELPKITVHINKTLDEKDKI